MCAETQDKLSNGQHDETKLQAGADNPTTASLSKGGHGVKKRQAAITDYRATEWTDIITLFDYPAPIRKAIYTTNAIESVNSVIRKFTRNRRIYPNEESALKLVYLAASVAPFCSRTA